LFALQRSVLFPRPVAPRGGSELERAKGVQVWLELPEGRVEAWFLPASAPGDGPRPVIVFAHGNGELIDHWPGEFTVPREWGLSVLLVEYPGYGRSAGQPSQASITEVMVAAWDWAAAQASVDRARIIGWGRSVGGGAACALSRERPLAALVLESTFTSVRQMARRFGLPGFLVRDPFDNLAAVRAFQQHILVLHGERDDLISPDHARSLHAAAVHAAAGRAELHLLPCGHNDCRRPWPVVQRFFADQRLL
jgi:hypothetical protein